MTDMHNPDQDAWLTPAAAGVRLGVSNKTLAKFADQEKLRARKLPSGHRRYSEHSVDELAAELERAS